VYARGRGWSDEVIQRNMLGYSGSEDRKGALSEELRKSLAAQGVDGYGPEAVALCGYSGDVRGWAREHKIDELNGKWVDHGYIPGLVGMDMLVYVHVKDGRICYYSGRGIREKRHYNLPNELVGARQPYFNHTWSSGAEQCVVVEGQADALSLDQWEIPAMAQVGTSLDSNLVAKLKGHRRKFMGLDNDKAGSLDTYLDEVLKGKEAKGTLKGMLALGPMTYLVHWERAGQNDIEQSYIKDANDVLKLWQHPIGEPDQEAKPAIDEKVQQDQIGRIINESRTLAEEVAIWAGRQEGARKHDAALYAMGVIAKLAKEDLGILQGDLVTALGTKSRDFARMLKAATGGDKDDDSGSAPVYTWGGYIHDWLIEYLYDIETQKAALAWRDPVGVVGSGHEVIIDGQRYLPAPPNEVLASGGVTFASALGDKKSLKELVTYIEGYLNAVYLMPSEKIARLISYWVMSTWIYDSFKTVIYLRAMGGAGSGKSELMKRIGFVCYRTMTASGAASPSSLFRALERYRGTVFLDEFDLQDGGDAASEMIKFINTGAMAGNPIWRTIEVTGPDGEKTWESVSFRTFAPKMIVQRRESKDAPASRSLTLNLAPRETLELIAANIPLVMEDKDMARAQALRNLLVRWRLETWQKEIPVDSKFYDTTISARLNQVAGPLLAIAYEDQEQQEDIRSTLRGYYREMTQDLNMTLQARVLEAMWKVWKYPDLHAKIKVDELGKSKIKIGDITKIVNDLINEMNETAEDDRNPEKEVKPRKVGDIIRKTFQMELDERQRDGYWFFWNEARVLGLSIKHGVNPDDFGPPPEGEKPAQGAQKPVQGSLV
jgi:hypothetical protein